MTVVWPSGSNLSLVHSDSHLDVFGQGIGSSEIAATGSNTVLGSPTSSFASELLRKYLMLLYRTLMFLLFIQMPLLMFIP